MKRRLALALILHIRQPADQTATSAGAIEDLLRWPELAAGGVTWSFPATLLERASAPTATVIEALRQRIESGRDCLAPCGYSGAPHGALLEEELKRELNWTFRNSWGSGTRSSLGTDNPGFFHTAADPARPSTLQRYTESFPFVIAGLDAAHTGPLRELILLTGNGRYRLAAADWVRLNDADFANRTIDGATVRRLARVLVRSTRNSPVAALLIEVGSPNVPPSLRLLLQLLARRTRLELVPVNQQTIELCGIDPGAVPVIEAVLPAPVTPTLMDALRYAARKRVGRRTMDQTRGILCSLANGVERGSVEDHHGSSRAAPEQREYIASMIGSAALSDESASAWFDNGALCRLEGEDYDVLTGQPALGWVECSGRRRPMTVQSAFSFESDHARGLSTYAAFNDAKLEQPGSLQIDALFVDRFAWLVLDLQLNAPLAAPDAGSMRFSPLEIPIHDCSAGQWIEIESLYPDGSAGAVYIETGRQAGRRTAWGSVFRIRRQDRVLSIGYPALSGPLIVPLTLEVTPGARRRCRISVHVAGYFVQPDFSLPHLRRQRTTLCIAPGEPDVDVIFAPPDRLHRVLL